MRVIALGDIHFPYHHRKALSLSINIIKNAQPTHVIQMGDLYEQKPFSRFPGRNTMQAEQELDSARHFATKMWAEIHNAAPNAKLIQILGNHDLMALKRCQEKLPAAQSLVERSIFELYQFENVEFWNDPRAAYWIGNVRYIHGHKKFGDHAKHSGHHTVCGHSHKGGVLYYQQELPNGGKRLISELNCGWLGDEQKYQEIFGYTENKISQYTLGLGMIDDFGPRFVSLDERINTP